MTGPERVDLTEMRRELRDAFARIDQRFDTVEDRLRPLEDYKLAKQTEAEVLSGLRSSNETRLRWQLGLLVMLASAVATLASRVVFG